MLLILEATFCCPAQLRMIVVLATAYPPGRRFLLRKEHGKRVSFVHGGSAIMDDQVPGTCKPEDVPLTVEKRKAIPRTIITRSSGFRQVLFQE